MKLTKAQRLFVAIGHVDEKINRIAVSFYDPYGSRVRPHPHPVWDAKREWLKELRARRKKLIREALEAWRDAELDNFIAGYNAYRNDETL